MFSAVMLNTVMYMLQDPYLTHGTDKLTR